jgi:DNA-binding NarL/FixJ family response regulator
VTTLRVVIADDQALVRAGFRMILEADGSIQVVGEAANGEQAIGVVRRLQPDVVLMDVRMPVLDGLEATRRILSTGALRHAPDEWSTPRVIMLTTFDVDEYVYTAQRAGASGPIERRVTRAAGGRGTTGSVGRRATRAVNHAATRRALREASGGSGYG